MLLMGWSPFPLPRQYENEPQRVAEKTIGSSNGLAVNETDHARLKLLKFSRDGVHYIVLYRGCK